MLRYKCLVLDHDDTVVQSESTVNYPCFCRYLEIYRPNCAISLADYVCDCNKMSFVEMCKQRFQLTDDELAVEYAFWKDYARSHIPDPFPGIEEFLHAYRKAGGKICVSSMSSEDMILRDYSAHFGFTPDLTFSCDLPEELRKPSPYALEQIMEAYHLQPEEILVIDDLKAAVSMARNAGCAVAFAGWGRQDYPGICSEMKELCDYAFQNVGQLSQLIFGENEA